MGAQESKQKLQQMTSSVQKMRKDIKNGKISEIDTINRCQTVLQRYTREIEMYLNKRFRTPDVDKLEQLIEDASKELDVLKSQELDLDLAAIPSNSFKRSSIRSSSRDKNKPIKNIITAAEEIRERIRTGDVKRDDYDGMQKSLIDYSQELSQMAKKHKKHETDAAQKVISSVIAELLNRQDRDSVRSVPTTKTEKTSATDGPLNRQERDGAKAAPRNEKATPKITSHDSTASLDDIENKLEALKGEIKVAEANKDKSRLHFLAKSIQTLMTDLHMVNTTNSILNEERQALLEKNLIRAHHQIDKIKKQLVEESDLQYLAELQKKEKKEKFLQDLEDIEASVIAISRNLNQTNYQKEKETFNNYKNKLNAIEDVSQEVALKKSEVFDTVLNIEIAFTKLEMEDRLNEAEWKHYQYRVDLKNFKETCEGDTYIKNKQYLQQLIDFVKPILEVSQKIDDKKKYVLYNIENNLAALEKKAKENEEGKEQVIMRKKQVINNDNLLKNLVSCFKEFEQHFSGNCKLDELRHIHKQLNELRDSIDERLRVLEYQIINEDPHIQLVTVKADYLDTPLPAPSKSHLKEIQKDVEALQTHIEDSRYTRDSQLYQDLKQKLANYKSEIVESCGSSEENKRLGDSVLNYIDNVLVLLDNNASSRKSTTEDILIDIMSVSTRVNDLGAKIQGFNHTYDYESIRNSLLEHKAYLKKLQITRTSLCKSRDDILAQIERYLGELDNLKKNEHSSTTSEDEKMFRQQLRKLKDRVSRFNGTYKNVLYKSIESDLNKCKNHVDHVFKDQNVASKLKRDIDNHVMILEQKSSKDRRYENAIKREPGTKELAEIRENIESVKKEIAQPRRLTKEELDKLDARLTLSILALDNIKEEHLREEKNKLYQDINLYFGRIQELMVVKPVINEDAVENQFNVQQQAAETIAHVEKKLEELKPEILAFVGRETSVKFFELDEALIGSTLKLDGLKLDKSSELHKMKIRVLHEIQKYSEILDYRVSQSEEIENLEKQINEMLIKIDSFNGYFGDYEYSVLDEEIISLKVRLGKMEAIPELLQRKEACLREVDRCMKKLNEVAKASSEGLAGTLV